MTVSQGLVLVVYGNRVDGRNGHQWFRITRRNVFDLARNLSSLPNFYYAKIYKYHRIKKGVGNPEYQIGYIHWDKWGILQVRI